MKIINCNNNWFGESNHSFQFAKSKGKMIELFFNQV